jgi:hypothetical protein
MTRESLLMWCYFPCGKSRTVVVCFMSQIGRIVCVYIAKEQLSSHTRMHTHTHTRLVCRNFGLLTKLVWLSYLMD